MDPHDRSHDHQLDESEWLEAPDAGGSAGDAFQILMRDARRHPLLTRAEEVALAQAIERGDLRAKERLVNSNIRLVVSIAKRFQGRDMPLLDLVQEGMDVVYHLYSTNTKHNLTVKTRLDNANLVMDTATTVWKAANWLERETAEMFGIRFNGHPDPRTLLMPEDMTDTFPLRKSHPLAEIEILQGEGMGYPEEGE